MAEQSELAIPQAPKQGPQRFPCPDCGHPMRVTHTEMTASPLLRKKYYQCTNVVNCGSSYKGNEELEGRIAVPPKQNNQIQLPIVGTDPQEY